MIKYTFKTYIFNGTEHYAYGEEDARGTTMFSQAVPFPDSLLSLAYMDVGTVEPIIRKLNDALWQLALTKDRQYQQSAYALRVSKGSSLCLLPVGLLPWKPR